MVCLVRHNWNLHRARGLLSGMNAGQAKPIEAFGGADGRETDNKLRRKEP
jgi:hypothetical protein